MEALIIDIGGTAIKLGMNEIRLGEFPSGSDFTPQEMVRGVHEQMPTTSFNEVIIGCPGHIDANGKVLADPQFLGKGWKGFDFVEAFGKPVRVVNDAALQAVGAYSNGRMLFLGLGTGLGTCLIAHNAVIPLEVADLPFKNNLTYSDHLAKRGLERLGKEEWGKALIEIADLFRIAFSANEVVFGGGHANLLTEDEIPVWCRKADNNATFIGGARLYYTNASEKAFRFV